MANGSTYGYSRQLKSGRWQAVHTVDGRQVNVTPGITYDTQTEADAALAAARTDRNRGQWQDPNRETPAFGAFAAAYIRSGGSRGYLGPRTKELYRSLLTDLADFAGVPIGDIRTRDIKQWRAARLEAYADRKAEPLVGGGQRRALGERRVEQALRFMKAVLQSAVDDEDEPLLQRNPAKLSKIKPVKRQHKPPLLSLDELERVIDAHPPHLRPVLWVTAASACRVSEVIALRRRDFDPATGRLAIERQTVVYTDDDDLDDQGKPKRKTETKNVKAEDERPPVYLVEHVAEMLRQLPATGQPDDLLFHNVRGQALTKNAIEQAWSKARGATAIHPLHTFHGLRGLHLTVYAGVPGVTIPDIKARAGHASWDAAKEYQSAQHHLSPAARRALVRALIRSEED